MHEVRDRPGASAARGSRASTSPGTGVVFIVGAARSGTTLLYKALCLHPRVAYISNWVARFPARAELAALNRLAPLASGLRRRVWFGGGSQAYVYGRRRPLGERLFPMPVEGERVYAACGVQRRTTPEPIAQEPPEGELARIFERIRRAAGGSHLISKRIENNLRIPFLARAFPEARFVQILRDGRAVAHSLSRVDWWDDSVVWWYGDTPRRWRDEGRDPWEICARNWVEELREIDEGLTSVLPERVRVVRYERFVADPIPTLRGIAAFAGLPPSRRWARELAGLSFPDGNQAWRDALDRDAIDRVTSIQRDALLAKGYEP